MSKKVLIVEDEASIIRALEEKLHHSGFDVLVARNGEEGLSLAMSEKPDCILLDIIMPRMDGMTMLRELRKNDWGREAKVIMLTNLSDGDYAHEAAESGAYDYLIKADWKIEDVINKVKERVV